jgi:short-subunit dehydrogenase
MSNFKGKNVLITGGASGIGRLMGELALKEGANTLVIWDLNGDQLQIASEAFREQGYKVEGFVVDVSNTAQVLTAFKEVRERLGQIDILINNAGIIVGKSFIQHTHADIDKTMNINTSALMHLTREALEDMIKTGSGHIVNIASAAGLVSNPNMSVYCGSKWAVIGWSDSLRLELLDQSRGIKVTTVVPYYINTGMFAGVRSPIIPILNPAPVARAIIEGVKKDKAFVRLPGIINLLPLVKGLLPLKVFDLVVGKWFGVYKSMDHFKGRKQ